MLVSARQLSDLKVVTDEELIAPRQVPSRPGDPGTRADGPARRGTRQATDLSGQTDLLNELRDASGEA